MCCLRELFIPAIGRLHAILVMRWRCMAQESGGALEIATETTTWITTTVFQQNQAGKGAHIYAHTVADFVAYDVAFEPFDSRLSVSLPGYIPILSSCEQYPCAPGESCSYTDYSLGCSPCPDNQVGIDGIRCSVCAAGMGPTVDETGCELCPDGQYSAFGVCQECVAPSTVSSDHTACLPPFGCDAGTACPDNTTCTELSHCVSCLPGMVSLGKEPCAECALIAENQISNPTQAACTACPAGKQPTGNHSGCDHCSGNDYSTIGMCHPCPRSESPNADRTACVACPEGIAQTTVDGVCKCSEGHYNTSHSARCIAADFLPTTPSLLTCQTCDELSECAGSCRAGTLEIHPGWASPGRVCHIVLILI